MHPKIMSLPTQARPKEGLETKGLLFVSSDTIANLPIATPNAVLVPFMCFHVRDTTAYSYPYLTGTKYVIRPIFMSLPTPDRPNEGLETERLLFVSSDTIVNLPIATPNTTLVPFGCLHVRHTTKLTRNTFLKAL